MADLSVAAARSEAAQHAPEREVARDLSRRALWVTPAFVVGGAIFWGWHGAISTIFALALVTGNFLIAARVSSWAARISLQVLMGAILISYILRLTLIAVATIAVHNASWFEPLPWGLSLIIAHLGLLIWEARHVSASLAFPALKPKTPKGGVAGLASPTVRSAKGL